MNEGGNNGAAVDLDMGADRETRVHPCQKRTWCINQRDHVGPCVEVPRYEIARADFGPRGKK